MVTEQKSIAFVKYDWEVNLVWLESVLLNLCGRIVRCPLPKID